MSAGSDVPRTRLQQQAVRLLDDEPDLSVVDLVSELDLHLASSDDTYPDWHSSCEFEPIVRALLLKELKDLSFRALHQTISTSSAATELGFDDVPHRTTFSRAWHNRLNNELQYLMEYHAAEIREYAHETDHAIDVAEMESETSQEAHQTTEELIRDKLRTIPREMVQLVGDEFDYLPDRAPNSQYPIEAFLETECTLGLTRTAAEQGTSIYNDNTDRDAGGPDGDTLLYYIKQLTEDGVLRRFHNSTGVMLHEAKKHLEFKRPVSVAIDITPIAYYGGERGEYVLGAPDDENYEWCHKYAAVSIVGENIRFILGLRRVREHDSRGEIVDDLLDTAEQMVSVQTVYADREFAAVDVLRALQDHAVNYVIPVPKNARIKRAISRMDNDVEVQQGYAIYGETTEGTTHERIETNLVLLPSTRDESKTVAFYTNHDVQDKVRLDRQETRAVINRYSRRWGIENAYKSLKTFLPWTTSNNDVVRLFHVSFGALLYNLWRLVDFLIQQSMDDEEFEYEIRLKAKRFVNALRGFTLF